MADSQNSSISQGLFIPTTNVWEIERIQQSTNIDPELKEIMVRLYQNMNNISIATNLKDTGYYVTQEFVTGQSFFQSPNINQTGRNPAPFRQSFRMVINFGALPNATSKTMKHNIPITSTFMITRFYGTATFNNGDGLIPIPYASLVLNENIEISADRKNVTITTGIDYSMYTQCIVVIEYLKQ